MQNDTQTDDSRVSQPQSAADGRQSTARSPVADFVKGTKTQPQSGQPPVPATPPPQPVSGMAKEQEPIGQEETVPIEEIVSDVEMEPQLEQIGVKATKETIELPPDMKQMGVSATGPAQPATPPTTTVNLPLTDEQIEAGLHAKIITSLRWLAEWCMYQLKKAHIHLKKISGRVVREAD